MIYKAKASAIDLVNELDNGISVMAKIEASEEYVKVSYVMVGPNSVTENEITRLEAEALVDVLMDVLNG